MVDIPEECATDHASEMASPGMTLADRAQEAPSLDAAPADRALKAASPDASSADCASDAAPAGRTSADPVSDAASVDRAPNATLPLGSCENKGNGAFADGPRRKPCCRRRGGGGGALVEPAALAALLYEDGYGYDMRRSILDHTDGVLDVDVGGLYRALRRLEEEGSVESRWGDEGAGPRRREYRLTEQGVDQAKQWLEALRQRQRLDGLIIGLLEEGLAHIDKGDKSP